MKKFLVIVVLLISSSSFGGDLTESQENIIKQYPSLSKNQKIECFKILSAVYTKSCPIPIDKNTEITSIQPLNNKPGLYYTVKLNFYKNDYSEEDWAKFYKKVERNLINGACSNPQYLFFRKLGDVHLVHDYVDKNNTFLNRFSFYFKNDCSE